MEHKIIRIITACAVSALMTSCVVHTATVSKPTPPPTHVHVHQYGTPGPVKRYPIDQLRKWPQSPHYHHTTPPPHYQPSKPASPIQKPSVRDVEHNKEVRNSGQQKPQQQTRPSSSNSSTRSSRTDVTPSRSTQSNATPSNTSTTRSSNNGASRSGGNR